MFKCLSTIFVCLQTRLQKVQLRSDNIIPFQFDKYITFGFLSVFNALIHGYVSLKPRHDRGFNFPFQATPDYFNKSLFL